MINYTIIVPHKNTPEYLQRCLDSIPVRDDVQVIVVDDNSNAEKVDFKNFPQWKGLYYEYYLTKEGKGAGYARNVALQHAVGKWLLFVDADDFLLPGVDAIFDEYIDSNADIIFFRPKAVMLNDRKTRSTRADAYNLLIDDYFRTGDTNSIAIIWMSPWSKFVRRDITSGIKFEEIRYSNDNVFSVSIACNATKIEIKDESFYVITQGENSLTSNFLNKEGELECRCGALLRAFYVAKNKRKDVHAYYETLKFNALKLHGRDWFLYTEYISCLKKEGIGIRQMLREQYRGKDRLHRWGGYINTFFHISIAWTSSCVKKTNDL